MADNQGKINAFFEAFNAKVQQAIADLPLIVGTETVNFALENFESESFNGQAWPKRKDKKNTKKLLVDSGTLRRSPRIIRTAPLKVTVGTDVPYAAVHNNGESISRAARSETFTRNRFTKGKKKGMFKKGTQSGQGFTFSSYSYNMPMRRFLGATPALKERLYKEAREHILNAIKD